MTDVFTPEKRSAIMAAIRSKGNRDTELKLITILRAANIRGWRRHLALPGKPDFVFRASKLAVFVDGCFWHGCRIHGRVPSSNVEYWAAKLKRNRNRDKASAKLLRAKGWSVLRLWEHELLKPDRVAVKILKAMA